MTTKLRKWCKRCEQDKPANAENFYIRGTGPYKGLPYGWCKPCYSEYHKRRYATEPEYREALLIQSNTYYAENSAHQQKQMDSWKTRNRERYLASQRAYWHSTGKHKAAQRKEQASATG